MEVDLGRAGVVQEPDDVGAARGRVRGAVRRSVRARAESDLAQSPETFARLVQDVFPGGEGGCAEVAEPEVARDQGVAGGERDLAQRSSKFPVHGPDAHLSVEAVCLLVFRTSRVGCGA